MVAYIKKVIERSIPSINIFYNYYYYTPIYGLGQFLLSKWNLETGISHTNLEILTLHLAR